jgi:hypothetical protein
MGPLWDSAHFGAHCVRFSRFALLSDHHHSGTPKKLPCFFKPNARSPRIAPGWSGCSRLAFGEVDLIGAKKKLAVFVNVVAFGNEGANLSIDLELLESLIPRYTESLLPLNSPQWDRKILAIEWDRQHRR